MDSKWSNPEKSYLSKSIQDSDVRRYLEENDFREPVCIVIGMIIARGAESTNKVLEDHEIHAQINIDLTSAGVHLSLGLTWT